MSERHKNAECAGEGIGKNTPVRSILSPELEASLRRFQQRMVQKVSDESEAGAEPARATFPQTLPDPEHVRNFREQAEVFLRGGRRLDYLAEITHWEVQGREGQERFQKSLADLRRWFRGFSCLSKSARLTWLQEKMATSEGDNLVRWQWLCEEVPWAEERLTDAEKVTLRQVKNTLYDFLRSPHGDNWIERGILRGKELSMIYWTTENRTRALGYNNEDVLKQSAFSGNSASMVFQGLDIESSELRQVGLWGDILDCGSGLSPFADTLRKKGGTVYTLDELSFRQLLEKGRSRAVHGTSLLPAESLSRFETSEDEHEKWHCVGSAERVPEIFGDGKFGRIFASDSITQPMLLPIYDKAPKKFHNTMQGVLRGLSPNSGEFRTVGYPMMFLYAPRRMERYVLPFLEALYRGGFEIPGSYGADGEFSFEKFIREYVRWKPNRQRPLKVRRHPHSDFTALQKLSR